MQELNGLQFMDMEWRAWQEVVAAFNVTFGLGKDEDNNLNDTKYDYVVAAVRHWGEMLVLLRCNQDVETRQRAAAETYQDMKVKRERHI